MAFPRAPVTFKSLMTLVGIILLLSCQTIAEPKTSGLVVKTEDRICYILTPENIVSHSSVCKDKINFLFKNSKKTLRYKHEAYQDELLFHVVSYLRWTHFSLDSLLGRNVDLWLSCHWLNPEQCEVVASVKTTSGNFSMHYPIEPSLWTDEPERILWLGDQDYPPKYPQKVGLLELTAKPSVNPQTLDDFLKETGVFGIKNKKRSSLVLKSVGAWPKITLVVEPFAEAQVANHIRAHIHSSLLLEKVALLPALERDGPKAKFSSTNLSIRHLSLDEQAVPELPMP